MPSFFHLKLLPSFFLLLSFLSIFVIPESNATLVGSHNSQSKQKQKTNDGLNNNIDKHGKKEMEDNDDILETTDPPLVIPPLSTIPPSSSKAREQSTWFKYHQHPHFQLGPHTHNYTTPEQEEAQLEASANAHMEDKMRRIIEMTVLICGITVILVVFFLSIRISAHLYKKFKLYTNQRFQTESGSVQYTANGQQSTSSDQPGTTNANPGSTTATWHTVMPGHFVLQPCFTNNNATNAPSSSSSANTQQVAIAGPSQSQDGQRLNTLMASGTLHEAPFTLISTSSPSLSRPETPPPPYPGPGGAQSCEIKKHVQLEQLQEDDNDNLNKV